jgi:hypothetical protein
LFWKDAIAFVVTAAHDDGTFVIVISLLWKGLHIDIHTASDGVFNVRFMHYMHILEPHFIFNLRYFLLCSGIIMVATGINFLSGQGHIENEFLAQRARQIDASDGNGATAKVADRIHFIAAATAAANGGIVVTPWHWERRAYVSCSCLSRCLRNFRKVL